MECDDGAPGTALARIERASFQSLVSVILAAKADS